MERDVFESTRFGVVGGAGKDAAEYHVSAAMVVPNEAQISVKSSVEDHKRKTIFVSEDVDDRSLCPDAAFEFFKGQKFHTLLQSNDLPIGYFLRHEARPEFCLEYTPNFSSALADGLESREVGTAAKAVVDAEASHALETPLQRIQRLQAEVTEAQQFLEASTGGKSSPQEAYGAAVQAASQELGYDPQTLLRELQILQHQLDGVLSDDSLQAELGITETASGKLNAFHVASAHLDKALIEITAEGGKRSDTAQKPATAEKPSADSQPGKPAGEHFSYELYTVPSMKPFIETGQLTGMEKRIADVENLIGLKGWSDSGFPYSDLHRGMKAISQRLLLLDPNRLESIGRRVQKLTVDVDSLLRRREKLTGVSPTNTLEDRHVLELYEMCEKWRNTTAALPIVIKRLRVLKTIHQEAAAISSRLNTLESQQSELSKLLDTTSSNFDALRTTVADNLAWIKLTVNDLHASIEASKAESASSVR